MMRLIDAYEAFARKWAGKVALMVDRMFAAPRRVRTETSHFVLGAEAMPAPVPARGRTFRR